MRTITIKDVDDQLHTINLKYLTRVEWGYGEGDVDMLYVSEGAESAEIAIPAKSSQSIALFEAVTGTSSHFQVLNYLHDADDLQ